MSPPPQEHFPSRQYRYPKAAGRALELVAPDIELQAGTVYRFVLGRDEAPQPMSREEIEGALHDPFARMALTRNDLPLTLKAVLALFDRADLGLTEQKAFVVADGGQVPWSPETADLKRSFRFVITRGRPNQLPDVFVSTSSAFGSEDSFLQVVGWDPVAGAHQFYDRRHGAWVWAGGSWDALAPATRGKGPFDSHVNGALNMKELKPPWIHWHSMAARIPDDSLAPGDPLRQETIWTERRPAQQLEVEIIRPGIDRWNEARFRACQADGRLHRLPEFFRQVLGTSTVNLVSSPDESRTLAPGKTMTLPLTFFVNSDALVDELGLDPGIASVPTVEAGVYLECLRRYDVAITDGAHRFAGDTHFAFVVPEPAFEDLLVLRKLRFLGLLPDKLAASLLMVDFCNPVFSARRAALLAHVPGSASIGSASDFPGSFVEQVATAAATLPPGSPEHEFLDNWRLPDDAWRPEYEARLSAFFAASTGRLQSVGEFAPLFELAESRRREFRRRPLGTEFRLTTPITNISEDAPLLELTPDARVRPKTVP
jgi:hypothetical protein